LHDPKDLKITADIVYIGTAYSVLDGNQVREKIAIESKFWNLP